MAKHLNLTRLRDTHLLLTFCLMATTVTRPALSLDSIGFELLDMLGEMLIAICVMGRIYCSAFLGGHKNRDLVTIGPFAYCRNPLYLCTFIGVFGIALISNRLILMLAIPGGLYLIYRELISREEKALHRLFGGEYASYCAQTPRLWPRANTQVFPDSLIINPKLLLNASLDGMVWFLALPIFEFIEYLQDIGAVNTLIRLY